MKTKDFISYPRESVKPGRRPGRRDDRPTITMALLGLLCAAGVLGALALLYQFG